MTAADLMGISCPHTLEECEVWQSGYRMQPQEYFILPWGAGARGKEDDVLARPKKERELSNTHIISIRLADIDMELLEEVRKKTNYTRSEYIRELIRGHTVKQEIHIQATDDVLSTFARSLQDICFRLNRIEKYFNTGGLRSLAMEDAIHQCIYDLMRLRKEFLDYAYDMNNSNLKVVKNDRVGL